MWWTCRLTVPLFDFQSAWRRLFCMENLNKTIATLLRYSQYLGKIMDRWIYFISETQLMDLLGYSLQQYIKIKDTMFTEVELFLIFFFYFFSLKSLVLVSGFSPFLWICCQCSKSCASHIIDNSYPLYIRYTSFSPVFHLPVNLHPLLYFPSPCPSSCFSLLLCLMVLSFTAVCHVESLPRCGGSLWRRK